MPAHLVDLQGSRMPHAATVALIVLALIVVVVGVALLFGVLVVDPTAIRKRRERQRAKRLADSAANHPMSRTVREETARRIDRG